MKMGCPSRACCWKYLEISTEELLDLFETATKLLAEADPDDHMRAYATRDPAANGRWNYCLPDLRCCRKSPAGPGDYLRF